MFQHYFSTFTFIPLPDSIATLIRFHVLPISLELAEDILWWARLAFGTKSKKLFRNPHHHSSSSAVSATFFLQPPIITIPSPETSARSFLFLAVLCPQLCTQTLVSAHILLFYSLNPLLAAFWQVCQWSLLSLSFLDPISSSIFELTSGSPDSFYFIFPRTIANIIWQIPKSAAARVLISNASYFHRIWKKEPTHQNWKWPETVHNQSRIVNEQKLC